jgi:hypothetical protein
MKVVDWSGGRRLQRDVAGQGRPRSGALANEETHRPPRGTRPPATEINGPYKKTSTRIKKLIQVLAKLFCVFKEIASTS